LYEYVDDLVLIPDIDKKWVDDLVKKFVEGFGLAPFCLLFYKIFVGCEQHRIQVGEEMFLRYALLMGYSLQ
jgi:hypothetical protein